MTALPFGDPASLAPPQTLREDRADGSFVLRHPEPLQPYARCIGDWLEHWAATTPDALFLAERDTTGGWRRMTYAQVRNAVGRIAQGLLDLQLPRGKPVVTLSDNSVDAALLALAAMHVGRPLCTVSSAYCRLTKDYGKIRGILDKLDPALVYASDAAVYAPAVHAWAGNAPVFFGANADLSGGAQHFATLLEPRETPAVMQAFAAIRPDDHAKYLLTSGSTGLTRSTC
jgi:feruloyl-CoA synthase